MPYFTHKRMVEWVGDAGVKLGFQVKTERRSKINGKVFQIDSTWGREGKLIAFVEAERRWEINHIIGHLTCCSVFAEQEKVRPYFVLVFLEKGAGLSKRLESTWRWLKGFLPDSLEVRSLPIHVEKDGKPEGLHASTVTREDFAKEFARLIGLAL